MVSLKIQPNNRHIVTKCYHFHIFFVKSYIVIEHIDKKEPIIDIFTKPLDTNLFG